MKIFILIIVIAATLNIVQILLHGNNGGFIFFVGILLSAFTFRGYCLLLLVKLNLLQRCIIDNSVNVIDIRKRIREVNGNLVKRS